MDDQDKHFLDKLTPKQRQFLTLAGISFLLFGVLWRCSPLPTPRNSLEHRRARHLANARSPISA